MRNEDAIRWLEFIRRTGNGEDAYDGDDVQSLALDKAIIALEQEPTINVLNKIREEIIEEKECAYTDFERYKVEYLGQDWEDAYDSLPQDDYRYGMERVIDIIDKYRREE